MNDWREVAILVGVIIPSIILHEVSHGWAALALGDDTAKRAGRLTLNPIAHVDLFGTIILPLLLAVSGFGVFGFAKPVPVNVLRLRNPRQHSLYVSLAGPATNLAIALVAALLLRGTAGVVQRGDRLFLDGSLVTEILFFVGFLNVLLGLFNLLPVPPLDGSALLERVLPRRWLPGWYRFRQYSILLVLAIFLWVDEVGEFIVEATLTVWSWFL